MFVEELDAKEKQLQKMEKVSTGAVMEVSKMKAKYGVLQKEVLEYRQKRNDTESDEMSAKMLEYEIQLEEYKRVAESVRLSGDELARRLEEASRRLVAERIHSAQSARKLQIVERCRNEERELYAKLRHKLNENISLHARQIKLANYEADLAAVEIARLQNIVLHSVPESEYEKLTKKYKSMLQQEFFFTGDVDDTQPSEHFGINLLKRNGDETANAEMAARNEYLENLVAVLSDQNEYWKAENEKIRAENDELKQFLEDIEVESTVKGMIVSIERRFLNVLAEKSEREQEELLATRQFRQAQTELSRRRHEWGTERKKFVSIIQNVVTSAQKIRRNAMEMITAEQMMELKERIADIHDNQRRSEQQLEEASKQKAEISVQLMKAEALKQSLEELKENNCDLIKLQSALQASHLNLLNVTSQLHVLKSQVEKKDAELALREEQIAELKKEVNALMTVNVEAEKIFADEISGKKVEDGGAAGSVQHKEDGNANGSSSTHDLGLSSEVEKHRAGIWPDSGRVSAESEESNAFGDDARSFSINADLHTKTVVFDNSEAYEKKIRYIRETAEVCIQNYKDQLSYKEEAVKKYRALLENLQSERNDAQRQKFSDIHEDEFLEEKKWKRSEEILNKRELEEGKSEILRLRNEIKDLEEANSKLSEQVQQNQSEELERFEVGVQVDLSDSHRSMMGSNNKLKQIDADTFSDDGTAQGNDNEITKTSGTSQSRQVLNQDIEEGERGNDIRGIGERLAAGASGRQIDEHQVRTQREEQLSEFLRKEETKSAVLRNEIRRLKQKLISANAKNQELQQACEDIRAEALAQIGQRYTKNDTESSDRETVYLRMEVDKLRSEVANQRRTLKSQKETIEALQKEQKKEEMKTAD
uniref:Uncharacterized protein n=1 Tax=Parascaris univalens TaxID=6257 RepID=A0A915C359_PARUN